MTNVTIKKVGVSDSKMYGPPKILVCGHPPKAQRALIDLLKAHDLDHFPMVFITDADETLTLNELLKRDHLSGHGNEAGPRAALVLSGFTEKELHKLLKAYRARGAVRPLLATLTPFSETWTVRHLLNELAQEAEAMKKMQPSSPHPPKMQT